MPPRATLTELCAALPFLRELPSELLDALDLSTLLAPTGAVALARQQLETTLGCNVMTYRTVPLESDRPDSLHLCRLLVPAELSAPQLEVIREAEAACGGGVVFVGYRRPLQLRR